MSAHDVRRFSPEQRSKREIKAAARVAAVRAAGGVPDECSSEIVDCAPARGSVASWVPRVAVPRGDEGWDFVEHGYKGKVAARVGDVFDTMADQALKAGGGLPFTVAQVETARHYHAITERVSSGNIKLSSVEGRVGGNDGRDAMDAYAADCDALRRYHRQIGAGVSMAVRRVRPSTRGGLGRRNISDRALVDAVCLGGLTLTEALRDHGWGNRGGNIQAARRALCEALDRMCG